jgi:predicted amidohydrolase YtcJ
MRSRSTHKLTVGRVKLVADGSIRVLRSLLARLLQRGRERHLEHRAEKLRNLTLAFHRAGCRVNCHCNGDEAIDAFIDAVAHAQADAPRFDHRHTIQHAQMITDDH